MLKEYKMYIDGKWVDALDGEVYEDFNPYTGEVFARVPSGKRADAKRAVDAAAAAFPAWSHTLPAERQALFLKAADILEKKQNEIVTILAEETGCTFGGCIHSGFHERSGYCRADRIRDISHKRSDGSR